MKIICISGYCCSGKSTAIEIMAHCLPNSAIVSGDDFLIAAILKHRKEFEEIYKTPLDIENLPECITHATNDASDKCIKTYRRFCNIFLPFIESKIENAVEENKKQGRDFIIVDYVSLPSFKIWKYASCRVMIVSDKKLRAKKYRERAMTKHGSYNENWHNLRENVFVEVIENASDIDFLIENKYNEDFEKNLINICQKIALIE